MTSSARMNLGCLVRAGEGYQGKQGLNYTSGISAGSQAIWLGSGTLSAHGGRTKSHLHENHKTAIYLLSADEVELWTGEQLDHREVAHPGDVLYVPAGVPHVAVNRSETPAIFVLARTDPNEQESVVLRPDLGAKVP